jgi:hypothetical protein
MHLYILKLDHGLLGCNVALKMEARVPPELLWYASCCVPNRQWYMRGQSTQHFEIE